MLILYTGDREFSSWSMRGRVALAVSGVPFEERTVELDWPLNTASDGALIVGDGNELRNPQTGCGCEPVDLLGLDREGLIAHSVAAILPRVPVLVDTATGAVVSDIVAIAEYLAEEFPDAHPLLPSDRRMRAAVRSLAGSIHSDFAVLIEDASYALTLRGTPLSAPDGAREQARWLSDVLSAVLGTWSGKWLFGDGFSLADTMLAPVAQQFHGWDLPASAEVRAYFGKLLRHPVVARHVREARRPYELIAAAAPDSPQWIVRHYRYNSGQRLLHDWQNDICHEVTNESARRAIELAYAGRSVDDISAELASEYGASRSQIRRDVDELFTTLHPAATGRTQVR